MFRAVSACAAQLIKKQLRQQYAFCPADLLYTNMSDLQGGSDISGTLSKLHHCIKK
jgi:hypothetical protein